MKRLSQVLILVIYGPLVFCQAVGNNAVSNTVPGGKTYAVVVGISKYANAGIPQLEYAHKDALVFSDYLKSKAGGQVPEENIRLLLNENATYAAIYDALDWLLATCQKDDLVYFYFSGHGDMENNTIYKLGFLLSYNTPRTNYINNAVRIEDLNNIANTLSVKVNAKVVLITDACHSGNLAGSDFRGTFLAGDQLRAVQNKEIRISSCAPDQLSAEDEGWGGGRGVFSFYLVNGLEGLADVNNDKTITVNEIKSYLDSSLGADALLRQKAMKQSPVIKGNSIFKLAAVDEMSLTALKKSSFGAAPLLAGALKPLPPQPQAFVFYLLQQYTPEALFNFTALNKLPPAEIPLACLHMLADSMRLSATIGFNQGDTQYFSQYKMELLEKTFRENKDAITRFNNKLAVALSDRGQQIINNYLEGDAAELERQRYYNSNNSGYDEYPPMFGVALKLTQPENYLYQLLQVKLHYFSGVAARIKIPAVEDPKPLIAQAMAEQQKAFKLEENAAYIQNELGSLYLIGNQMAEAEKKLKRATQIAPKWAMPHANLAALYLNQKKFDLASAEVTMAISLQPDLQVSYIVSGFIKEKTSHLLLAEELFRKSIDINSRHYLPFERLGYVYMNTTQYEKADSMFFEADKRKKGFHFLSNHKNLVMPAPFVISDAPAQCIIDSADIGKNDILGQFALAIDAYLYGNFANAEKKFKQVIALDKTNPLAFHHLGILLYNQHRWKEAAIIFNFATSYFLDSDRLEQYADSLARLLPDTKSKKCIFYKFIGSKYDGIDDHYFLGRLYEKWNHFSEAEAQYRQIIKLEPAPISGYYMLWNMLELTGRYDDAENVLRNFVNKDSTMGHPELCDFYKRMIARFPGNGNWYYKAGIEYYFLAAENKNGYRYDKKNILPDSLGEEYQVGNLFTVMGMLKINHLKIAVPGILEAVKLAPLIVLPRSEGIKALIQADSLLQQDEEAIADINYKIADLYVWQGTPVKAISYYRKSLELKPANANTRLQLITIYDAVYQFSDAIIQLDSLYRRQEIDFDKQVLMAKYYIHESRFDEAGELLKDAVQVHPYKIPAIVDLNGRLRLLSGKPKEALAFYKAYLLLNPDDAATLYTIARLYARTGNTPEAWKWLELAMDKGFNFSWVLKLDEVWNQYRSQARWKNLQQRFPGKEYPDTGS